MLTDDQVRDLLHLAAATVDVRPDAAPIAARRRAWPIVASAASVALVLGGGAAIQRISADQDPAKPISPARPLPYVEDNKLVLALPDGRTIKPGLGAQEVLGLTPTGVVLNSDASRLLWIPVDDEGRVGTAVEMAPGPVVSAALSQGAVTYAYIDLDHVFHLRRVDAVSTDADLATTSVGKHRALLDTDGDTWVMYDYKTRAISVQRATGSITVPGSFSSFGVELTGDTLVMQASDGRVQTFDATNGELINAHIADAIGSISPDGTTYVSTSNKPGEAPVMVDLGTGTKTQVDGIGEDQFVTRVVWQGMTRFYAEGSSDGGVTLWSCTVRATCERLSSPTGRAVDLPYG